MQYGRAVRIVRSAHNVSQSQLAERIGISPSHLSLIESGKRAPSLKMVERLSTALEVPVHLLTLLASDAQDLKDGKNAGPISDVAQTLLYLLTSAGEQPRLPLKGSKK